MKVDGFGVEFDDLDEGIDGPVGLFIDQVVEPLEIGAWQRAGFAHQVTDVDTGRDPAECKQHKRRNNQKPPGCCFHGSQEVVRAPCATDWILSGATA